MLAQLSHTGTVRVLRVESESEQAPLRHPYWAHLPCPQDDVFANRDIVEARRGRWGNWHCATNSDTLETWWEPGWLAENGYGWAALRVLELPRSCVYWCGTQYILKRDAARVVGEWLH